MSLVKDYTNFYIATATIIPVLYVVFAIQNTDILRSKAISKQAAPDALLNTSASLSLLVIAESAALAGLLGFQSIFFVALSILGLGFSFMAISISYLGKQIEKTLTETKADESWNYRTERITTYIAVWLTGFVMVLPGIIAITAAVIILYRGHLRDLTLNRQSNAVAISPGTVNFLLTVNIESHCRVDTRGPESGRLKLN